MLRLLGFPKAKPESGHGCLCCLACTLFVRPGGAEGRHKAWQQALAGCAASGLEGLYSVGVFSPSSTKENTRKDALY